MPFLRRTIQPVFLSRRPLVDADGKLLVGDDELEAVTNNTLACVLRQLASLVLVAEEVFGGLAEQLQEVQDRTARCRARIDAVEMAVAGFNPKTVTVPESDICAFASRTVHHAANQKLGSRDLFTPTTRPRDVQKLYDACVAAPVRGCDAWRKDGRRSSTLFICTPVLGAARRSGRSRKQASELETSKPAILRDMRRWTSREALGDVTVAPDTSQRILAAATDTSSSAGRGGSIDHRLPSPEEQSQVVALHFPGALVRVDVTGRAFDRMQVVRRSLDPSGVQRRRKHRHKRGKRRNTIASTDQRELQQAVRGPGTSTSAVEPLLAPCPLEAESQRMSRLDSLKSWGRGKLRQIRGRSQEFTTPPALEDEANIYETMIKTKSGVRLRERRSQSAKEEAAINSSSGNWSASSESGRASVGSENTASTHQPKSTTLSSPGTSSVSLNHAAPSSVTSRRRFNTSTSSSFSEGTLTPDPGSDQLFPDETSSTYSCDTEGYYTSFHLDSGLRTLREEDQPITALLTTCALTHAPPMSAENEYELFGKGSTSTTTSSAGTVCTTLLAGNHDSSQSLSGNLSSSQSLTGNLSCSQSLAPSVPERKSSLDAKQRGSGNYPGSSRTFPESRRSSREAQLTPDSGRNTSSSPGDSPADLDEDLEIFRAKTEITSGRIPSMCVITPPQSDDDTPRLSLASSTNSSPPLTTPTELSRPIRQIQETHFDVDLIEDSFRRDEKLRSDAERNGKNISKSPPKETAKIIQNEPTAKQTVVIDSGDYVTIADTRNKTSMYANCFTRQSFDWLTSNQPTLTYKQAWIAQQEVKAESPSLEYMQTTLEGCKGEKIPLKGCKEDYVSLTELPNDSLERKPRGARVTLDAEGRVVYSSDSLKRKQHSSFEPGPCVTGSKPTESPHRVAKQNIRPVNRAQNCESPSPSVTSVRSSISPTRSVVSEVDSSRVEARKSPTRKPNSPKSGRVIVHAQSPNHIVAARSISPNHRAAARSISPNNRVVKRPVAEVKKPASPEIVREEEGKVPPLPPDPHQLSSYLQRTNPALFNRLTDPTKVKRSDSYRMANSSLLAHVRSNDDDSNNLGINNKVVTSLGGHFKHIGGDFKQLGTFNGGSKYLGSESKTLGSLGDNPKLLEDTLKTPVTFLGKEVGRSTEVVNPNALGRRVYGPQLKIDPSIFSANRKPARAANGGAPRVLQAGYPEPPRYVSPPSANELPEGYWSLPTRRPRNEPIRSLSPDTCQPQGRQRFPMAASIPRVPAQQQMPRVPTQQQMPRVPTRQPMQHVPTQQQTSTPVKDGGRVDLDFSRNFSPIQKQQARQARDVLVSPPKTSMTSEEIYAAIHATKKRLNIRTDSSSPPGLPSASPADSPNSRKSWSPDSSEYYDFYGYFENQPDSLIGSRQSWSPIGCDQQRGSPIGCDRQGRATTSRNDFKKLLSQHGSNSKSKLSAVEQLKVNRLRQNLPCTPRKHHRVQPPRSPAWRFPSPRSDVLSSTIVEDSLAEDRAQHASPPGARLNPSPPGDRFDPVQAKTSTPNLVQAKISTTIDRPNYIQAKTNMPYPVQAKSNAPIDRRDLIQAKISTQNLVQTKSSSNEARSNFVQSKTSLPSARLDYIEAKTSTFIDRPSFNQARPSSHNPVQARTSLSSTRLNPEYKTSIDARSNFLHVKTSPPNARHNLVQARTGSPVKHEATPESSATTVPAPKLSPRELFFASIEKPAEPVTNSRDVFVNRNTTSTIPSSTYSSRVPTNENAPSVRQNVPTSRSTNSPVLRQSYLVPSVQSESGRKSPYTSSQESTRPTNQVAASIRSANQMAASIIAANQNARFPAYDPRAAFFTTNEPARLLTNHEAANRKGLVLDGLQMRGNPPDLLSPLNVKENMNFSNIDRYQDVKSNSFVANQSLPGNQFERNRNQSSIRRNILQSVSLETAL